MKILGVAKAALYGIFLNYYCFYTLTGRFIPGGTVLFLGLALLCVGYDVLRRGHLHLDTEIRYWIVYTILAFVTTMLATMDSGSTSFISDIIKYAQRLLIIMTVAYICEREGHIRFGLQLMAVTAVASAIAILLVTDDIRRKLSISTGADLSANDIGAIMAFGCFAVVFAWGKRGHASLLLSSAKAAGFICCLVVIFLAGSRKSIGAVLVMLAVLLVLCLPDYGRHLKVKKLLTVAIVGTAAYLFITKNLLEYAEQTNLYSRLFGQGAEGASSSDEGRMLLIKLGLKDFAEHPFFGLGFAQFTKHHGNYTHCTYVEPLACSGIMGLLYLYPYYTILKKQLYLIRVNRRGSYARLKQKEMFAYLCMFLFVGVGIPYMYKDIPCILLGTFIANQTISFRELRSVGHTSADY